MVKQKTKTPEKLLKNINSLIKKAKKSGKSHLVISKAINVNDREIYRWRAGECFPVIKTVIAISNYFDVTIDSMCRNRHW